MEFVLDGNVFTLTTLILLTGAAFVAGFVDSMAGGGGLIFIPASLALGFPPQLSLEQNKATSTFGTFAAIINYARNKSIHWNTVIIGLFFSLSGSFFGAKILLTLSEGSAEKIIIFLLPFALLITFFSNYRNKKTKIPDSSEKKADLSKIKFWVIPLVTFSVGFYDGFFGPGTGTLLVLFLHFFIKLDLVQAAGTSKVFNFCSNISALVTFLIKGKIILVLIFPLAISNILGNLAGSQLVIAKGSKIVTTALAGSIGILILSLGLKYFL